jgi:hypothetical protein
LLYYAVHMQQHLLLTSTCAACNEGLNVLHLKSAMSRLH